MNKVIIKGTKSDNTCNINTGVLKKIEQHMLNDRGLEQVVYDKRLLIEISDFCVNLKQQEFFKRIQNGEAYINVFRNSFYERVYDILLFKNGIDFI